MWRSHCCWTRGVILWHSLSVYCFSLGWWGLHGSTFHLQTSLEPSIFWERTDGRSVSGCIAFSCDIILTAKLLVSLPFSCVRSKIQKVCVVILDLSCFFRSNEYDELNQKVIFMRYKDLPLPPTKIKSLFLTISNLLDEYELGHKDVGETWCAWM